eukprot:TRINITY_DN25513_c0_g1_i1.p1 TRINITY_DN25513_c0_g1~~TRINITY_DN25513_c0_g1_i1.p1  ORF type:complete len:201 (-),score=50.18 TRINITY_DN25513_c0_g1_i1:36-638(-)
MVEEMQRREVPYLDATPENTQQYGVWIGAEPAKKIGIPFYKHVVEGANYDFKYHEKVTFRTAQIFPSEDKEIRWLEKHRRLTQVFVGLGCEPFELILGAPTHEDPDPAKNGLPNLDTVRVVRMPPGSGIMLHLGTWHDFPRSYGKNPITVLTFNSEEVVLALSARKEPGEMDEGDTFKIDVKKRLNIQLLPEGYTPPQTQ